jgi:hypothetical protein
MSKGYVLADTRKRIFALAEIVSANFTHADWLGLGTITGCLDLVRKHDRLLRSLNFGDPDYAGHVHEVLLRIVETEHANLAEIEGFVADRYGGIGENISTAPSKSRSIVFTPSVFETPPAGVQDRLVAVMMPFAAELEDVFLHISIACDLAWADCLRAKDIWENEIVIQDIFNLICRSSVVVCDFTGRNPNVFYEAGIAHTLGKTVIPITQSEHDIPFDLRHHRYLKYLNNKEGKVALRDELAKRLNFVLGERFEF